MAYTPDPFDSAEPTESKTVESAALEFRTLKPVVSRTLRFPAADADSYRGELPAAAARAGRFLAFNATTGKPEAGPLITQSIGGTDAALVGYTPEGTGAVATTVQTKLRESVSVMDFGAVGNGVADDTTAFSLAFATGKAVYVPRANYTIASNLTVTLATGQDFILRGDGPEASRLVFSSGAGLTVQYAGNAQGLGDQNSITICGLGIETSGIGTASGIKIVNTVQNVVNDTECDIHLYELSFSGTSTSYYWLYSIYLENATFASIHDIKIIDGYKRTIGIKLISVGTTYRAVDTTIYNVKMTGVATGIDVSGECEGVYLSNVIIVGCTLGVNWVAPAAGATGKNPLLVMTGCHINTSGTAIYVSDVAQMILTSSLLYITNSTTAASIGVWMESTSTASSENNRLSDLIIIGIGSRVSALSTGVKCGANVFGVLVDATIDNVDTAVDSLTANRTVIAPSARLTNYNTRSVGFYGEGVGGTVSGGASLDGSLQLERTGAATYSRDMFREQLRVGTHVFVATSTNYEITVTLSDPFRTDTSGLMVCMGTYSGATANVHANLPDSTNTDIKFRVFGLTIGVEYRVNYIAYGY